MIGSLMMCVSAVILLAGMLAGIVMGIKQDFALAPAHAHLNLVGGVLLFLFGPAYSGRRDQHAREGAGLAAYHRRDRVPDWRRHRHCEGRSARRDTDCGLPDRNCGDGAVRRDRVPDRASLSIGGHFLSPTVA